MSLATAERALLDERRPLTRAEVDAVAALPLDELPSLVALAHRVRLAYMGSAVELESLINAKSGACPEDCAFCSQSVRFDTAVDVYAVPRPRRGARRRPRDARRGGDAVLHRRRGAGSRGATAPQGDRRGGRGARRDRTRSRVLTRTAHRRAGRATGRGRRPPLQPQPRSVPRSVPFDLHDPHLRRSRRHRAPRDRMRGWSSAAAASSGWARRSRSASTSRSSSRSSHRARCP